ncbi:hypothetical protein ACFPES_14520 [Paenibacillus sp. GCM10023248]|uniref:glycosyl hydrolase family 95 catalytic domain-containing protein n=1 Tax=unclassified Paenibacillus TaxID=185978 RepID=UPI002379D754|nr:hypothetical protein [Paenibacillus sp. MAHUQ-63]MDD9268250.1 hypothetical protein [Paenibacillus sp. MAHUQ-63]
MKAIPIKPQYVVPWALETAFCHHGIPLSNGVYGALVWFQQDTIMITVNRADYWDHRGGIVWTEACTYANLKELLQRGDVAAARQLYPVEQVNGKEKRPTRLPMGRFELKLREEAVIESAALDLQRAEALIVCRVNGQLQVITMTILMDRPVLLAAGVKDVIESLTAKPAYDFAKVKAYYDDFGIMPHKPLQAPNAVGWVQELPADPACAVQAVWAESLLQITAEYGASAAQAEEAAARHLTAGSGCTYDHIGEETRRSWKELWAQAADIQLPDEEIERIYYLGIYRMLGNAMPGRLAPTLQGPWAEEYRMPPWSCDYHFNINVQECLWPAYGANLLPCLQPLFAMIDSWKPILARNAARFVGIDNGYMLGHSVDDRGYPVGGMWTGTIDQANTSWVAQMMWQYARYAGDPTYLVEEVYPFMKGALRVFAAMMERDHDTYALPVSVSPEYGGSSAGALGRNSTFFLVNVRFLCDKLIETAETHGIKDEELDMIRDIRSKLPAFTAGPRQYQEFGLQPGDEIYLWEGQPLSECHRHHSHLAGIYPFDTFDMSDPYTRATVDNAYRSWVDKGMGRWAGWSLPWASILHNRLGKADMALFSLHILKEIYMMPGYATAHNGKYAGFTQFVGADVMQVEAAIAAAAAVLEMYVQCVRGTLRVFSGLSARFKEAAFAGIRAEGAFLLSGSKTGGRIQEITVYAERSETLRLVNPFSGKAVMTRGGVKFETDEACIALKLSAGETVVFTAAASMNEQASMA